MDVLILLHLKMACMFMRKSFKVGVTRVSFCDLTCMEDVGAWKMLGVVL